jgi:hypothetical protein
MAASDPLARRWRVLTVTTAGAGLAAIALVIVSQVALQAGGAEPAFDAPAEDTLAFFEAKHPALAELGGYGGVLALITLLWFQLGIAAVLRRAEGELAWRSTIAAASGTLAVALVLVPGWELGLFRTGRLSPEMARLTFDMGNLGFATAWVAIGSFLLATGWVLIESTDLPSWLGWWAVVAALALIAARAAWTSPLWLVGYSLFWLWVIVASVLLLRGGLDGPLETVRRLSVPA